MSKYVEGFDVNQLTFFPMSFDDMIDEDNPVRSISAIVDTMDDTVLTFTHSKTKSTGRPPYNPVLMFKIYLYCYYNVVRSYKIGMSGYAEEYECTFGNNGNYREQG